MRNLPQTSLANSLPTPLEWMDRVDGQLRPPSHLALHTHRNDFSGQPDPVPQHLHCKEFLLYVKHKFTLFQFKTTAHSHSFVCCFILFFWLDLKRTPVMKECTNCLACMYFPTVQVTHILGILLFHV